MTNPFDQYPMQEYDRDGLPVAPNSRARITPPQPQYQQPQFPQPQQFGMMQPQ